MMEFNIPLDTRGYFHFLDQSFAEPNRYVYSHRPQGVNCRVYLHVLNYLLCIIIILKQKGVMQTYKLRRLSATFSQNYRG